MKKGLTYQELQALAKEHYCDGGDVVCECWDERAYNDHVKETGPITKKRALDIFRFYYRMENTEWKSWL